MTTTSMRDAPSELVFAMKRLAAKALHKPVFDVSALLLDSSPVTGVSAHQRVHAGKSSSDNQDARLCVRHDDLD